MNRFFCAAAVLWGVALMLVGASQADLFALGVGSFSFGYMACKLFQAR